MVSNSPRAKFVGEEKSFVLFLFLLLVIGTVLGIISVAPIASVIDSKAPSSPVPEILVPAPAAASFGDVYFSPTLHERPLTTVSAYLLKRYCVIFAPDISPA